ncbi:unnamed protein product [Cercospora beticola]|nr:unnamed protein product [Cercospora beticola]
MAIEIGARLEPRSVCGRTTQTAKAYTTLSCRGPHGSSTIDSASGNTSLAHRAARALRTAEQLLLDEHTLSPQSSRSPVDFAATAGRVRRPLSSIQHRPKRLSHQAFCFSEHSAGLRSARRPTQSIATAIGARRQSGPIHKNPDRTFYEPFYFSKHNPISHSTQRPIESAMTVIRANNLRIARTDLADLSAMAEDKQPGAPGLDGRSIQGQRVAQEEYLELRMEHRRLSGE